MTKLTLNMKFVLLVCAFGRDLYLSLRYCIVDFEFYFCVEIYRSQNNALE